MSYVLRPLPKPSPSNSKVREYVEAVQKGLNSHFVMPTEKGWSVRRTGASKASGVFNSKTEAVAKAKQIAKNQKTDVFVFNRDGELIERKSYQ